MNYNNILRNYSILYVLLAIMTLLLIILNYFNPEVAEAKIDVSNIKFENMKPTTILAISYVIEAICYLIYALLLRQFVSNKSKGTLLIVLLIMSICSYVATLFKNFDVTALLGLLVHMYVLQLVFNSIYSKKRKEVDE